MARIKFGSRLIRGFIYGLTGGGITYLALSMLAKAVNAIAGSTLVNAGAAGLIGFALFLFGAVGTEISKEMEETK